MVSGFKHRQLRQKMTKYKIPTFVSSPTLLPSENERYTFPRQDLTLVVQAIAHTGNRQHSHIYDQYSQQSS
ncbi:MAG: hypothetical protein PUP92_04970 [Rhizonema sp. PD38]|nr:hypothetical protein [Rhizonema sp. PD38]